MIMIDLETLGTTPGSVVLSVGVVEFDLTGVHKEHQVFFDVADQHEHGLTVDPETVMWWFRQGKEAQQAILGGEKRKLADGLKVLTQNSDWGSQQVWANGASFDFPILKALYDTIRLPTPWKFYNENCYRTIKNQYSREQFEALRIEPEIAHDGLEDAKAQALTLINMLRLKKAA